MIDDKKAREEFGDDQAIPFDLFTSYDDRLEDMVEVAATMDENADKDVLEYFDFCIQSTILKRFLGVTPSPILAH